MEKVIEIKNLTKSYGKFKAIDDLSMLRKAKYLDFLVQMEVVNLLL